MQTSLPDNRFVPLAVDATRVDGCAFDSLRSRSFISARADAPTIEIRHISRRNRIFPDVAPLRVDGE